MVSSINRVFFFGQRLNRTPTQFLTGLRVSLFLISEVQRRTKTPSAKIRTLLGFGLELSKESQFLYVTPPGYTVQPKEVHPDVKKRLGKLEKNVKAIMSRDISRREKKHVKTSDDCHNELSSQTLLSGKKSIHITKSHLDFSSTKEKSVI